MSDKTYLVLCATGKQGRATVNALLAKGIKSIVCSSRNPESASSKKLLDLEGVTKMVKADMNDSETIVSAIKESGASCMWFTTDFWSIKKATREKEAKTGKNVIDAIKKCGDQIEYVVYSSVGDADNCPETVEHFWSKADVEKYMASELGSSTKWSVIRPTAFFENMDDAGNYNPLTKGKVKFLTYAKVKVKFIATEDIGKGSAALLLDPDQFSGKKIEAAGGEHDGTELAEALTKVSGTKCKFATSLPRFVLWLFMRDLYHMTTWFESSDGYTADIDAFKKIVPDAKDAEAWFASKGQWANGEKFVTTGTTTST
jgi:uncharacterized protein YbjT (DUF2867 family)